MLKDIQTKELMSTEISILSLQKLVKILVQEKNITVAVCNVNSLVKADKETDFNQILNSFSLKIPDGMPLVWYLNLKKIKQERLNGLKIFYGIIEESLQNNARHFFLGSSDDVLEKMAKNLKKKYPNISISGTFSPSIGNSDQISKEVENLGYNLNASDIVWVGLGMPKQEEVIYSIKNKITSNMIGVGAVFEWVAGTKSVAPKLLQNLGLEWMYRLLQEPKRLWKRYFFDFIYLIKYNIRKIT